MYTITINGNNTVKTDLEIKDTAFKGTLNDAFISGDLAKINEHQYHLLYNNKSYMVEIIKLLKEEKTLILKVNSVKFNLQLKDKYDALLHSLGLDNLASKTINEVKAPMPGMVLNILVAEGDIIKKGDPLIVLEAMKMENILKSPTDGTIKKISAVKGNAVEKNQILIHF